MIFRKLTRALVATAVLAAATIVVAPSAPAAAESLGSRTEPLDTVQGAFDADGNYYSRASNGAIRRHNFAAQSWSNLAVATTGSDIKGMLMVGNVPLVWSGTELALLRLNGSISSFTTPVHSVAFDGSVLYVSNGTNNIVRRLSTSSNLLGPRSDLTLSGAGAIGHIDVLDGRLAALATDANRYSVHDFESGVTTNVPLDNKPDWLMFNQDSSTRLTAHWGGAINWLHSSGSDGQSARKGITQAQPAADYAGERLFVVQKGADEVARLWAFNARTSGTWSTNGTDLPADAVDLDVSPAGDLAAVVLADGSIQTVELDAPRRPQYSPLTHAVGSPSTANLVGGAANYTSLTLSGAPAGVVMNQTTKALSVPTNEGTHTFSVTGNYTLNGFERSSTTNLTWNVTPAPTTFDYSLDGPYTRGVALEATPTVGASPHPVTFSTASVLPAGLTLDSDGTLHGTPTAAGTFNISFTSTTTNASTGLSIDLTYGKTLTIAPPTPEWTTLAMPHEKVGVSVDRTIGATGADTFALTAGALPPGLSLASTGSITGTPTTHGSYSFTVRASTTESGVTATTSRAFNIQVAPANPTFVTTTLTSPIYGTPYSTTIEATADPEATFSVWEGALPNGISLASDGTLSGTTFDTGVFEFTVTASSSDGVYAPTTTHDFVMNVSPLAPIFATNSLVDGKVGVSHSDTIVAVGDPTPTYSVDSGSLPNGVSLAADGTLSGEPTQPGSFTVVVRATSTADGLTASETETLTIDVAPADPTFTGSSTLPAATDGVAYSTVIAATSDPAATISTDPADLPAGLTLAADGTLSGTPAVPGEYSFDVTASATAAGLTSSTTEAFTLHVAPAVPVIDTNNPTAVYGQVGLALTATLAASGEPVPTFAVAAGDLPDGVTLGTDGVLSGTPTEAGTFGVTIEVTSAAGSLSASDTFTLTLNISPADPVFTTAPELGEFTAGEFIVIELGTNSNPPATFALQGANTGNVRIASVVAASGRTASAVMPSTLPDGLTLSASGRLSGTVTAPGAYSFVILATTTIDGLSSTSARTFSMSVAAAPLLTTTAPAPTTAAAPAPASAAPLAYTGSSSAPLVAIAVGLIAFGGLIVGLRRRAF